MATKQYIQPVGQPSSSPKYDPQTQAFIQNAKQMMANNHGLALDRDPAEIMKENNRALHEAAKTMSAKKGMTKQTLAQPVATSYSQPVMQPIPSVQQPVLHQMAQPSSGITDTAMKQAGYDAYMQNLMNSSDGDDDSNMTELSEAQMEPQNDYTVQQPVVPESPIQQTVFQQPRVELPTEPVVQQPVVQHTVVSEVRTELPRQQSVPQPTHTFTNTDYTNCTDVRGLPSEGLLYEMPIMGQSLTLTDVLLMNYMDSANVTSTINSLFSRRLFGGWSTGIVPANILHCDEAYLMHWLRASTIDTPLPYESPSQDKFIPYTCPECGGIAKTTEDYARLNIKFENLDFKINGDLNKIIEKHRNGCYTFELDDHRQCDLYLRRRYHEDLINEALDLYRKDMHTEMPVVKQVLLHTAVVVEIEGIDNIVKKIDYLGNLGYKAAKHFYDEVEGASLTTDITARITCPFCGKEVTIPYPFRLDSYLSGL